MSNLRHNQIVETVNLRGECSVGFLARKFAVSDMTVRRDLQTLAESGRVLRTHGGAAPAERISFEFNFLHKVRENQAAKQAIAEAAAGLVRDGQSVFLESGTTTLAVARALKPRKALKIVTTSLPIASELQFCENVEVLLLGGLLRRGAPDLAGALTESNLEQVRTDIAFLSADGIDARGNIYSGSMDVVRLLKKMLTCTAKAYVVADSSKIGHTAVMRLGHLKELDGLITDRGTSRALVTSLTSAGAHVRQV
jgi:DeoR/GlpR family transcriptional regulator of sugar metabolism